MMTQLLGEILHNPAFLILIATWTLSWKGLALWRAAKNNQKRWFIAILILNTLGILEIIYLTWFVKQNKFWDKIKKKKLPWIK